VVRFVVLAAVVALSLAAPVFAATGCAAAVLRDWSEDGRVGTRYAPPCYERAIEALPPDLRDYTNAEDVITRALTSAVRASGERETAGPEPGEVPVETAASRVPVALLALGGVATAVLAAGALAYAARRRRSGAVD